jgi:hypothetical protein
MPFEKDMSDDKRLISQMRKPPDHPPPQRDLIAQWRSESFLDRRVRLGITSCGHPERGETPQSYYRKKFGRGEHGRFWFHHVARARE